MRNPARPCACGGMWPMCTRHVAGGYYRQHPGQLIPYRSWIRENCPAPGDGFVYAGDDGFARVRTTADPVGWVTVMEWKSRSAEVALKDRKTMQAIALGRLLPPLIVRMNGDVPSPLQHWPDPCDCCGLPYPVVVSTWITINGHEATVDDLIERMTTYPMDGHLDYNE